MVLTLVAVYAHLAGRMRSRVGPTSGPPAGGPNFGCSRLDRAHLVPRRHRRYRGAIGSVFAPGDLGDPTPEQIQALSIGCTVHVAVLTSSG